jgi:hypothetical protein
MNASCWNKLSVAWFVDCAIPRFALVLFRLAFPSFRGPANTIFSRERAHSTLATEHLIAFVYGKLCSNQADDFQPSIAGKVFGDWLMAEQLLRLQPTM